MKKISRPNSNIVIDTKSINSVPAAGMMAWRSDTGKPVGPFATHDVINAIENTPYGQFRTAFCLGIEVGVKDGYIWSMRSIGPNWAYMLYVLLGMHKLDVLISYHSVYGADQLYLWMRRIEFLLQHFHYEFYTLGSLWMLSLAFVLRHSRIIY